MDRSTAPRRVVGAGGLVVRAGADGDVRIAVVHGRRDNDWSFPKGTMPPGGQLTTSVLREVAEKIGQRCEIVGTRVGRTDHIDRHGRAQRVHYWIMRPLSGHTAASDEVDAVQWLRSQEAVIRLTHEHERMVLRNALEGLRAVVQRGHSTASTVAALG